ncbi:hypothetical protein TBLA_0B04580 [Henningerozyma blattae CBS 6284]|uniref:Phosphatidylinositol N-acetylglucosaminyltransferase n=1 Tax=Henningerozyma blattae (strain ATCC 34711 / CBS 6284 / DSM 70876 / NBRC 10599 / NRRL Y-10934 / UCD 77-7) TaxID=1071380 RepID=I2GYU2_HENB6|nr:hypothetical protein TBLA_0B04580 [Tetrapisispora blattae CBS 6284]CCH59294.1 hypothetical protein TBLA_0B04580 [Tetrapisispora blattae CBS 6284]
MKHHKKKQSGHNNSHNSNRGILRKPRWKRILWQRQPYPDNYTDLNFLDVLNELKKWKEDPLEPGAIKVNRNNITFIRNDFIRFYESAMFTSFIYITFVLIYYYNWNPIRITLQTSCLIFILLFIIHFFHSNSNNNKPSSTLLSIKSSIIIVFTLSVLSPVLKSLSKTTSSDSIWTLSFWMTITYIWTISPLPIQSSINELGPDQSIQTPSNLSTNLLLANMAVLASRLSSGRQVFCFLLISIQLNIILPRIIIFFNHYLIFTLLNMIIFFFTYLVLGLKKTLVIASVCACFLIVLPEWFFYWQKYYKKFPLGVALKTDKQQMNPTTSNEPMSILTAWDTKKSILD